MKKAHGNGLGISLGGTTQVNTWNQGLANVSEGVPVREWKPFKVAPHPERDRMAAYAALPSLVH